MDYLDAEELVFDDLTERDEGGWRWRNAGRVESLAPLDIEQLTGDIRIDVKAGTWYNLVVRVGKTKIPTHWVKVDDGLDGPIFRWATRDELLAKEPVWIKDPKTGEDHLCHRIPQGELHPWEEFPA